MKHWPDISRHIRTLCNAWICRNLAYSESWNIQNPYIIAFRCNSQPTHIYKNLQIFRTLTYLKPDTYSEPYQRFKIELLPGIVKKTIIIFPKRSILDLWLGFEYAYLSINVARTMCIENSDILRHIQVPYRHIQWYCGISRTVWTLAYWERCHIQNRGIFRTQDILRTLSRHILNAM